MTENTLHANSMESVDTSRSKTLGKRDTLTAYIKHQILVNMTHTSNMENNGIFFNILYHFLMMMTIC